MAMKNSHRALAMSGVLTIFLAISSLRTVPPATVGVVTTLGSVDGVLRSGTHLVNPFASVRMFSTKTQLLEQQNHGAPATRFATVRARCACELRKTTACVLSLHWACAQ